MKISITINADNDAFEDNSGIEVARILRKLADELDEQDILPCGKRLYDINGNFCGNMRASYI